MLTFPKGGHTMNTVVVERIPSAEPGERTGSGSGSAVAWSAVLAGAAGAIALSLILVILGMALGLSAISPWVHQGMHAAKVGSSAIGWVILIALLTH